MKNSNLLKIIMITIIILIILVLFISIVMLIFNDTYNNTSEVSNNIITSNNTVEKEAEPIIIPIEQEDHIYGYDENAMQVASSYNGFPACGFLEIPKTGLALPILSNQTVSGMEYSCCFLYTTGELNLSGNTYIVGHNYDNGTLFSNNKNLAVGDKIILTGLYKNRIEYTIYNMFNTTPDDVSYLTKDIDEKNIEITLQTCNNDAADTRLIIEARHEIKRD